MTSTSARAPNRSRTDLDPHLPALREALEQQRRFRVDQLAELAEPAGTGPAEDPHELVRRALRSSATAALAGIRLAIQRLDDGTYGRCARCGVAIGLERLEVLPAAVLCMPCQYSHEGARR